MREFEPEAALGQALELFWEKGYEDTSFDDIVAATSVSRYGLYTAFGNKRELFRKVLQAYADYFAGTFQAELRREDASLPEIRGYFEALMQLGNTEIAHRGCMICNTAVEVAPEDPEIAADVRSFFADLTAAFHNALSNARQQCEIDPRINVDNWAVHLTALTQSLALMAKLQFEVPLMRQNIEAPLSALERLPS